MADELERLREENAALRKRVAELEREDPAVAFLESILAVLPAYIFRADANLEISYINRVSDGWTFEQVIGTNILEHMAPDSREEAKRAFELGLSGQPATYHSTVPLPDGAESRYDSYVAPLLEPDGSTGICVISFDVTEHHHRQHALQASEEKLRIAIEATGIGLWSWDMERGVVEWDDRMRSITGRDDPVDTERWVEELVHPEDRELVARHVVIAEGTFQGVPHRIVRSDGAVRWVLTIGSTTFNEAGAPAYMYGGILDVTDQHAMEEQIRHGQKLEAVGSLTAGVAHNFNNLLMAILPTLDMLAEVVPQPYREFLSDATHAAERGAELVRQLMTFAGQRRSQMRVVSRPETLVQNAIAICRRTFDRVIALELDVAADLPNLSCDAGAIEHALVNVLLNARDALMPDGGRIEVRVRQTDSVVCIEVEDDGPGMSSDVRDRIFEPFYTTKGPRGTGLGLSTVYAVIKEHEGTIDVDSGEGGTSVRICLPATGRSAESVAPDAPAAVTVLLVEDEAAVRRVVRKMLEGSGYSVLEAVGVGEALVALEGQSPQLVLLDRSMPSGSGRKLVPELRRRVPTAKILYFTGQHIPPDERSEVDGVIQKPVRLRALVDAIDRALHQE